MSNQFYTPRVVKLGKYKYDLNKVRICECSSDSEIHEIEDTVNDRIMYFSGNIMYFNLKKKQYECFWCGKVSEEK